MEQIDLLTELNKGETLFINKIVSCSLVIDVLISQKFLKLHFENCVFQEEIKFTNIKTISKLDFYFIKCSFKKSIDFENVKANIISFDQTIELESLNINGFNCEVNHFSFVDSSLDDGKINLFCEEIKEIKLFNLEFKGHIYINLINNKKTIDYICISNVILNNLFLYNCRFNDCEFDKVHVLEEIQIEECFFNILWFTDSVGGFIRFAGCEFNSNTNFLTFKGLDDTHLVIQNSYVKGVSNFNGSEFDYLEILNTLFEKNVSFDSVKVNAVHLYQVTFSESAFFDNFKITNPFNNTQTTIEEKKRTYRTIKQELQKLDNRIDYNTFRVYELTMHSQEVNRLLKNSKLPESEKDTLLKDKCILYLHHYVSNFGTDWRKALSFILCTGFTFYTILYMIENANKELDICAGLHGYINGFFKYILVTNFDNPLLAGEVIKEEVFKFTYIPSYFVFIFGKILIAFGIYEMVQSFRKFRY